MSLSGAGRRYSLARLILYRLAEELSVFPKRVSGSSFFILSILDGSKAEYDLLSHF